METLILPEMASGGHRLVYLRAVAEEALRQEMTVVLAVPRSVLDSQSWGVHLRGLDDKVQIEMIPEGPFPDPQFLQRIAKRYVDPGVLVLHGDAYAARAARWKRSNTPVRPSDHEGSQG